MRKKGTATGFCLVVAFYLLIFSSQSIVMIKIGCLNSDGGKKKLANQEQGDVTWGRAASLRETESNQTHIELSEPQSAD